MSWLIVDPAEQIAVATNANVGVVKPDGSTILVAPDGTISSTGGGGGGAGTPVSDEQVAGGTTVWTLANDFIGGTLQVYSGAGRLHEGADYTITGANEFTTNYPIPAGTVWADYEYNGGHGTPVTDEQVADGPTVWNLAHTPLAGTLQVYSGAGRLHVGVSADFTMTGLAQFTTNYAVPVGTVWADYEY